MSINENNARNRHANNRDDVISGTSFIPRLVAFLVGDRCMGDCVDLPLVVEGISLGKYLMFSNEI